MKELLPIFSIIILAFFCLIFSSFKVICDNNEDKIIIHTEDKMAVEEVRENYRGIIKEYPYIDTIVERVVITDKNVLEEAGKENNGREYRGLADQNTNTIYLNVREMNEDTLLHECIHLVDYNLHKDEVLSLSDEYKFLMTKNLDLYQQFFVERSYDISSYQESFVAVFFSYKEYGKDLQRIIPDLYEYMDKIVDKISS